jgi:hypothetical protein
MPFKLNPFTGKSDYYEISRVELDPNSLHLDQDLPQSFTDGTVTGTGFLIVTSGELGLATTIDGGSA